MDPLTSFALTAVLTAAWFSDLYLVVYLAVRSVIRDKRTLTQRND
jgi:hypothetical protein